MTPKERRRPRGIRTDAGEVAKLRAELGNLRRRVSNLENEAKVTKATLYKFGAVIVAVSSGASVGGVEFLKMLF